MRDFPVHPDEVTPQLLSEIFGRQVTSVSWEPIGTGQVGDSARFHLEGADIPATLAGKFPAADATSRGTAAMFGLYRKEVEFYRQAAPLLDVRVPKTHLTEVSEDGAEFTLLFEDMGPARQGDQISGCGIEDARAAIRQAAAIHAPSWGRADIIEAHWIQPPEDLGDKVGAMYPQAQAIFRDRYEDSLEGEYMQICEELAGLSASYFRREPEMQCLVHGDFRLDNMLFDICGGKEPVAILDWQTVAVGKAMIDVGYFLGCGIGKLGLDHEDELLDLYLAEMADRGVPLTRADIVQDYRRGILHGVSTAVFSAAFVERTERGDDNFLSMARGACALALKHDSIGALKEAA
ncbi:aminoglycoside phosphotransferase family protein [Qipengyuania aquimaris]|uniref:aminoglycoside phosphotransferase family protein n=1 Tax=Qipengyuania aquimaris TaxID=255984 RepID=UPI001FD54604|nr:phosphotransferase [Qipengyuania aquimaris]UOR14939.1 phosphotransferase [Qipengyuania aquimaris]